MGERGAGLEGLGVFLEDSGHAHTPRSSQALGGWVVKRPATSDGTLNTDV
jgi:hypothetical protein